MNFRMSAIKINFDKILTFFVAIALVAYIVILMLKEFDFSSIKDNIKNITGQISVSQVYDYVENHPEYYYKIEDSVYCISKEELRNSNEVSEKVLNNIPTDIIEVEYKDNVFNIKFNDDCIER